MDGPNDAQGLIRLLDLEPIPLEGGWFRVTWRSATAGAIVALFTDGYDGFSALHRLTVTELWFAHGGDPFELLLLRPDGGAQLVVLGADVAAGEQPQVEVPPGVWMGGRPRGPWSLLSTVTVPAYSDDAFTLGRRSELVAEYPGRSDEIVGLTRS